MIKNVLFNDYCQQLKKALSYLEYSYAKVQKLPVHMAELDQETLQAWEGFSARFSRVADIFLSKYVRTYVAEKEPGFRGSMRDIINMGEKLSLLDDADAWVEIREMRNVTAHEYSDAAFDAYIGNLLRLTPHLINIKKYVKQCA